MEEGFRGEVTALLRLKREELAPAEREPQRELAQEVLYWALGDDCEQHVEDPEVTCSEAVAVASCLTQPPSEGEEH